MSTQTTTASMFQSIKDALNKNEGSPLVSYNEILKLTPGNTYTVRLVPYAKDPKNTFFHYYNFGWVSFATGQYVQALSPTTFGERDPIAEERFKIYRVGSDEEKEKVKNIKRLEKYLVNVYVIDDPTNSENNGKVKMLRYGKQLHKIITEAIEGEDSEEFGEKIFDLGPEGVNFKIKCEAQGEFPSYVSSRFTASPKLKLTSDEQAKILEGAFDLTQIYTLKSYDELKQMLDEHYYCKTVAGEAPVRKDYPKAKPIPLFESPESVAEDTSIDDQIEDLLKDL